MCMAEIEPCYFCSVDEYEERRGKRKTAVELKPKVLYAAMLLLENEGEAAVLPAKILSKFRVPSRQVIKFAFLDEDLRTQIETRKPLVDNCIKRIDDIAVIETGNPNSPEYPIAEAYFLDYPKPLEELTGAVAAEPALADDLELVAG